MKRVAVFGANGQVGRAMVALLGDAALPLTRLEADLSEPHSLATVLDALQPDAVINAAAYTAVDKAEEERELASRINADSPSAMAQWCAAHDVPFLHFSTDYVFDGTGESPWRENDPKAPLNHYGASKLAGEDAVQAAGGKYLILRCSWLYDAVGKNFFNTMLHLAKERDALRVVADQWGAPTYAPQLAECSLKILRAAVAMEDFPSGVYHLAHTGFISWHGFAEAIFAAARENGAELCVKTVEPIPSSAYPTPAERPRNSRLNCSKIHTVFGAVLPKWEQGLAQAIEVKYRAGHHLPD